MKQSVTSSSPLTFTGCWPIGPEGAVLGLILGNNWTKIDFFFLSCHRFKMCTSHSKINEEPGRRLVLPAPRRSKKRVTSFAKYNECTIMCNGDCLQEAQ